MLVSPHNSAYYLGLLLFERFVLIFLTIIFIAFQRNLYFQIAFHPSGSYLVSCSSDTTIKIFDLISVQPVCTLYGHSKVRDTYSGG
jgi:WD40 repeat protein